MNSCTFKVMRQSQLPLMLKLVTGALHGTIHRPSFIMCAIYNKTHQAWHTYLPSPADRWMNQLTTAELIAQCALKAEDHGGSCIPQGEVTAQNSVDTWLQV